MTIYEKAKEFALAHIEPIAKKMDDEAIFPVEAFKAMGEEGFLKLMVPKEFGGEGATIQEHARVCMAFAESSASAGLCYMMHNVCLMVVLTYGSDELKKEVCEKIVNEGKFCALAYSEFGTGTHFYIPNIKADHKDGYTVLNGRKSMVTSAEQASFYLISAPSTKEGLTDNWLIPLEKEGVKFDLNEWNGVGMRGNVSSPMTLTDCKLEDKYMVGEPGTAVEQIFAVVAPYFVVGLASVYSGLSLAIYEAARKHAIERVYPNGQGLINIETVQIHLANLYNRANAAKYFTLEAARSAACGEEDALPKILASRINASEGAIECSKWAMRIGGGKSYNKADAIERYMRDSYAGQIMAPSVDVLIVWLGKAVTGQELI
ncbi:MAG: acyl-CoA/acyl-ACP dehydrogenase [Firmicutes bacterium]|nr:acyl-CoA/acyl-ACP dehydrogenase [Ezakiella sp.]MDD7761489.1 acyl-CoA/acyl-ACP dehydrogenase [Bacillota bacterium]